MKVTPVKTQIIEVNKTSLFDFLADNINTVPENSIVAVTSKVVSLCEGNALLIGTVAKDALIEQEADMFLPKSASKYGVYLTIKNNILTPNAGIDESNTNGFYVPWPKDPQNSANICRDFIAERFNVKNVGVIITDSVSAPLKWGVTGISIAHCGFKAVNDFIGSHDLFGRELRMTKINVADALAAAAVLCMGETSEQTPMAIIEDVPFVEFVQAHPSQAELEAMRIGIEDDLYSKLLKNVKWKHRRA